MKKVSIVFLLTWIYLFYKFSSDRTLQIILFTTKHEEEEAGRFSREAAKARRKTTAGYTPDGGFCGLHAKRLRSTK
jgi:hypothetical protein